MLNFFTQHINHLIPLQLQLGWIVSVSPIGAFVLKSLRDQFTKKAEEVELPNKVKIFCD